MEELAAKLAEYMGAVGENKTLTASLIFNILFAVKAAMGIKYKRYVELALDLWAVFINWKNQSR